MSDRVTKFDVEVFGDTPPGITKFDAEVFGVVILPEINLTLQESAEPDIQRLELPKVVQLSLFELEDDSNQPTIMADFNLELTTQEEEGISLGAYWGYDIANNLTLQEVDGSDLLFVTPAIDIDVQFTLQDEASESFNPEIVFSIDLTLQATEDSLTLDTLTYGTELNLSQQEGEGENFPLESQYGTNVELTLKDESAESLFGVLPLVFLPSEAKYVEINRSGVGQVVFGVNAGPFKFNPAANIFRRNGRSHVIHLAPVKPDVVTNQILFQLLTPWGEIEPEEFYYTAPGGFLEIWNTLLIQSGLVADGNTTAIPVNIQTVYDAFPLVAVTSFEQPREQLP